MTVPTVDSFSFAVSLPHVLPELVSSGESVVSSTRAARLQACVDLSGVALHMTLQFILAIEQLRRRATGDATLQYLTSLATWWDRVNVGANDKALVVDNGHSWCGEGMSSVSHT